MAHYENLPIYKAALDLTIYIEKIVRFFSRYHKYTVGTDLRDVSRRILILIAKANIKEDRVETLLEALEKLDELKILIRLCKELKAFRSYAVVSGRMNADIFDRLRDTIKSYLGHFKWGNTYRLMQLIYRKPIILSYLNYKGV